MPAATTSGRAPVHLRARLVLAETAASLGSVFQNRNLRRIQLASRADEFVATRLTFHG